MSHPNRTSIFTLKSFVISTVVGVQNQQRPQLIAHLDGQAAQGIKAFMAGRVGTTSVLARSIAAHLSGLVAYDKEAVDARQIPGGWQQDRCVWQLVIAHAGATGIETELVLAGYTDRVPEIKGKEIDWEGVLFYVNSSMAVRPVQIRGEEGPVTLRHTSHVQHVLFEDNWDGTPKSREETRVRPMDQFSAMSTLTLQALNQEMIDTRTMNTTMPALADRRHVVPSRYLSDVLSSYLKGQVTEQYGQAEDQVLAQARGYVASGSPAQNPFFAALGTIQGMRFDGHFTFNNLKYMMPEIESDKTQYFVRAREDVREDTPCDARTNQVLLYLSQTMTALIHSLGLWSARLSLGMEFHDEQNQEPFKIMFVDLKSMDNDPNLAARIEHAKGVIAREILPEVRRMGCAGGTFDLDIQPFVVSQISYHLLFGDTVYGTRYFASYADSLTTPLVMASRKEAQTFAADLYAIINCVTEGALCDPDEIDPFTI